MLLVVVASRRVLWPQHGVWSSQHSTPLTFTSLLSLSLAAAGVGSPAPRLHAHHSAAPGAPWRREAHRRAVRSSRGAVPSHSHTLAPHSHSQLSLPSHFHWARCTVGTQWMVLLLVGGGGRIHFQNTVNTVNTEYAANFWRGRLEVVRAIFAVISSTL